MEGAQVTRWRVVAEPDQVRQREENVQKVIARQLGGQLFKGWTQREVELTGIAQPGEPLGVHAKIGKGRVLKNVGERILLPLIDALARYRQIEAQGGWQEIAPAEPLVPGLRDESVGRLKDRLRAEGDLSPEDVETPQSAGTTSPGAPPSGRLNAQNWTFDESVTAAVARFQKRYGLEATGKVDKETLAEMVGTTRSRVNFFMNKFRDLGFIEYNGDLKVHTSLLSLVLHD